MIPVVIPDVKTGLEPSKKHAQKHLTSCSFFDTISLRTFGPGSTDRKETEVSSTAVTTEGATLISHVLSSGKFTEAQLTKALMLTPKRFKTYQEGEKETPRSVTEALNLLAEHVGYPDESLSKEEALKLRSGDKVRYHKEDSTVIGVSKTGVMAPYFSLLSPSGIYTSVPFRLISAASNGATEPATEPVSVRPNRNRK